MTADERQEAERVWGEAETAYWNWFREHPSAVFRHVDARKKAEEVIAAARVRWQNEALEEAAAWCKSLAQTIRALKK